MRIDRVYSAIISHNSMNAKSSTQEEDKPMGVVSVFTTKGTTTVNFFYDRTTL